MLLKLTYDQAVLLSTLCGARSYDLENSATKATDEGLFSFATAELEYMARIRIVQRVIDNALSAEDEGDK